MHDSDIQKAKSLYLKDRLSLNAISSRIGIPQKTLWYNMSKLGIMRIRINAAGIRKTHDPRERFWRSVQRGSGCWIWSGHKYGRGYGHFNIDGIYMQAHRASYILNVGPIPDGLCVCHKCDNPSCVNPSHLFLGTHKDNARDMMRKKRFRGGRAKLDFPTAQEIRKLRDMGFNISQLSRKYGVHRNTIRMIILNRSWSPLTHS